MEINQISVNTTGGITREQLMRSVMEDFNLEQWTKIKLILKLFFYQTPSLNICSLSYVG